MDFKKIGKKLLFPPIAIMITLAALSVVLLVFSMVRLESDSFVAIISYVLSAYTLTVWCFRIPNIIKFFKNVKDENKYIRRWLEDERLRMNVSLYGAFTWNIAYGLFQLWLGFHHNTFWFYSFAVYYIMLAGMRFFLVRYTRAKKPGERMREELIKYRACGIVFLIMNLALSLITFFMVYWNRTFVHHEITTITMAAYTFGSFAIAIVNIVKYRKYQSPIYSAAKAISLAAASVSILTLESTMLTVFGEGTMDPFAQKLLLGLSGVVICLFIIVMAVYMISQSNKELKSLCAQENENGK